MSTRHNNGSHYENHRQAAELHDKAAHAHRAAAEHGNKQDHQSGQEHSRQALEHSQRAYLHSQQVHQNATREQHDTVSVHEATAVRAHDLWVARGCPEGSPDEDWFQAEEQFRSHA
jgi:hypothetical protein